VVSGPCGGGSNHVTRRNISHGFRSNPQNLGAKPQSQSGQGQMTQPDLQEQD